MGIFDSILKTLGINQELLNPAVKNVPQRISQSTPTPYVNPTASSEAVSLKSTPLSESILKAFGGNYPYQEQIAKTWPNYDQNKLANIIMGESSFRPNLAHINAGKNSFSVPVTSREQWLQLRRQYPSIDAGLLQINTADAVSRYLESKGLTYYDLIENPELNLKIANDLYSGRIPQTAPGIGNWYAARGLGYND